MCAPWHVHVHVARIVFQHTARAWVKTACNWCRVSSGCNVLCILTMSSTTALMQADVSGRRRSSEGASASASFLTCSRRRSSKMETILLERKRSDVSLGHGPHAGGGARDTHLEKSCCWCSS